MQRNSIVGNIAKIMVQGADKKWDSVQSVKGGENGTKVFVNIADHYWSKDKGGQITRFIPMQGFVPRNLTIEVGMLYCTPIRLAVNSDCRPLVKCF